MPKRALFDEKSSSEKVLFYAVKLTIDGGDSMLKSAIRKGE